MLPYNMADRTFSERPAATPWRTTPVERVVRREPLAPIHQVLSISIHDIVNEARIKSIVADFYRVTRWIENERWLRRQLVPTAVVDRP